MSDYEGCTFVVDVDGTLCPVKGAGERYEDLVPYPQMVERLREVREGGGRIVLHTSRQMRTYGGNLGLINKNTAPVMLAWLERWDIPYDEIIFGKPWPGPRGFYVDDRAVRPDEFLSMTPGEMAELCEASRPKLKEGVADGGE